MAHFPVEIPHQETITFILFVIFTGTAIISTLALYARQSLLVAYIVLGMLLGPEGFKLIKDPVLIKQIGDVGVIFLLFLLGLSLNPYELIRMLKKTSWIAFASSVIFWVVGFAVADLIGLPLKACAVVGAAMMFSSTIVGLKLLPTTMLHHRHTGEVMISLLLLQDIIAIIVLLFFQGTGDVWTQVVQLSIGFPLLLVFAYFFQRYVLIRLMTRFDLFQEYIFLLSIGWCLAMAEIASVVGLSPAIGAFMGGVSIATHPVSQFISENLKPLRDFFLVMFFFQVGAQFDFDAMTSEVIIGTLVMATLMMFIKPFVFKYLLQLAGETKSVAWEVGVRLAQISEFSILIAYIAFESQLLGPRGLNLIQGVTIITFVVSTYWVVLRFPTPVAMSDRLRMD